MKLYQCRYVCQHHKGVEYICNCPHGFYGKNTSCKYEEKGGNNVEPFTFFTEKEKSGGFPRNMPAEN